MQGKCYYCKKELTERTIKRHIKNCPVMSRVIEEKMNNSTTSRDQFIISLKDKYSPKVYSIYISIDANLQLHHLDQFIRNIWVECCGHLSVFYINGHSYADNSNKMNEMNVYLKDVLNDELKFEYEYDFGSTTSLILEVVDILIVPKTFTQIEIIARNKESVVEGIYYNSPRDGVCAYVGDKESEIPYQIQNSNKYKISRKKPIINKEQDFNLDELIDYISTSITKGSDNEDLLMEEDFLRGMITDELSKSYNDKNVINSFEQAFLKGKYSFDLEELLKSNSKKQLNSLAESIKLKLPSNSKKDNIIEKYINEYESLIKNKLNMYHEDVYKILKMYIKNNGIMQISDIKPEKYIIKHAFLMDLGILFPTVKDERPILIMPDIMQNIVKKIDSLDFRRIIKANSKIMNIFLGMIKAYGVIYFDDVITLIKRYSIDIDESILIKMLDEGSFYYSDNYYAQIDNNGKLIYINEEIGDYAEILEEIDNNSDYKMISEEELISMSKEDYLIKTIDGKKFAWEFSSLFEADYEEISQNMNTLALDIQYRNIKEIFNDIFKAIEETLEEGDGLIIEDMVIKFIKTIPLWKFKGETLNEREGKNVIDKKEKKVKYNDPCPCGSGKKFMNCCSKDGNVIYLT